MNGYWLVLVVFVAGMVFTGYTNDQTRTRSIEVCLQESPKPLTEKMIEACGKLK